MNLRMDLIAFIEAMTITADDENEALANENVRLRNEIARRDAEVSRRKAMRPKDAAVYLAERGIKATADTLYRWRREGTGPEYRQSKDARRCPVAYTIDALDQFIANRTVTPERTTVRVKRMAGDIPRLQAVRN